MVGKKSGKQQDGFAGNRYARIFKHDPKENNPIAIPGKKVRKSLENRVGHVFETG